MICFHTHTHTHSSCGQCKSEKPVRNSSFGKWGISFSFPSNSLLFFFCRTSDDRIKIWSNLNNFTCRHSVFLFLDHSWWISVDYTLETYFEWKHNEKSKRLSFNEENIMENNFFVCISKLCFPTQLVVVCCTLNKNAMIDENINNCFG